MPSPLGLLKFAETYLKQGGPEEVAKRIASGELPIDEASRAARRDAFGIPVYHASKQDIPEFKAGYADEQIFTTPFAEFANNWLGKGKYNERIGSRDEMHALMKAERARREASYDFDLLNSIEKQYGSGSPEWMAAYDRMSDANKEVVRRNLSTRDVYSSIYPLRAQARNTFDPATQWEELLPTIKKNWGGDLSPESMRAIQQGHYMPYEHIDVTNALRDRGYDSIWLSEQGDNSRSTLSLLSPNQLRSEYAMFDPEYTGPNILGSRIAPTAGAGALGLMKMLEMYGQDEDLR